MQAVNGVGILAVTGVKGLSDMRDDAFDALQRCADRTDFATLASSGAGATAFDQRELPDGSVRRSVAGVTEGLTPSPLGDDVDAACPGLRSALEPLRRTVGKVRTELLR